MKHAAKTSRPKGKALSWGTSVASRLILAAGFLAVAGLLVTTGMRAIRTESYRFTGQSDGTGDSSGGTEDLEGVDAVEHGIGLTATGVMLILWSAALLWSICGPLAVVPEWSRAHSVLTFLSLASLITAMIGFFPPWQIGQWGSSNGMYLTLAVYAYLGTVRDRSKLKELGQQVFPALIVTGIFVGMFWAGFMAGVLVGIFVGFGLVLHILLLIPKARAEIWKSKPQDELADS